MSVIKSSLSGAYNEASVRYVMADIALGGNRPYYVRCATIGEKPDAKEALRRIDSYVKVMNAGCFERKYLPSTGWQVSRVGAMTRINGCEILLSSDWGNIESQMRAYIAYLSMGMPIATLEKDIENPAALEAMKRFAAGVRFINPYDFDKCEGANESFTLYHSGSKREINGGWVRISTDEFDEEMVIKSCLADMLFGGDVDYYRGASIAFHSRESVRRYDAGITMTNAVQFERKELPMRGMKIVYKGTDVIADPHDFVFSNDAIYPEARHRYILADLSLGGEYPDTTDPDVITAKQLLANGVTVSNLTDFSRVTFPGKGNRLVFKNTTITINGMDVLLSNDH